MKYLFIGAHPDDIELYCAGTIAKLKEDENNEIMCVVCTNGQTREGDRVKEQVEAFEYAGIDKWKMLGMADGFLVHDAVLVSKIDLIVKEFGPDTVFTHRDDDFHQDHIAVARTARSAGRGGKFNLITFGNYEEIDNNSNLTVDVLKYSDHKKKVMGIFKSQADRWYIDIIRSFEYFKIEKYRI
jgi:LmbE family N-acetylglucosaminyl deacetylase